MRYDLDGIKRSVPKAVLYARQPTLWRYRELLPLDSPDDIVTLGESATPLIEAPTLGQQVGLHKLFIKDEGLLPTGTFKARGAAVGVSRARELEVTAIALPTAGNAGAAWAAYGARAGIGVVVVMPADTPEVIRRETATYGARVYLVDGSIADAAKAVREAVTEYGWDDASTLREPYRIEGKKTMGFELAEQLGWRVPDVVVYPTGGGVGLIGMWKAFQELAAIGWIEPKLPRFVSVQSTGCAPIVKAFDEGREESEPWPDPRTIASGLRVPKALGDFLVLRALRESNGTAVGVDDDEIRETIGLIATDEGVLACPEGAAGVAAAYRLRQRGWLDEHDEVVVFNTGSGLKYGEALPGEPERLGAGEKIPRVVASSEEPFSFERAFQVRGGKVRLN
ncbi:MAG: threonine synthase [Chloroflexi bacterium 13_1_40CM_4_68_4]|nr:MAG: threonine synthase [Chloroflexi bacterium 13_1_40CM_4_68_4]